MGYVHEHLFICLPIKSRLTFCEYIALMLICLFYGFFLVCPLRRALSLPSLPILDCVSSQKANIFLKLHRIVLCTNERLILKTLTEKGEKSKRYRRKSHSSWHWRWEVDFGSKYYHLTSPFPPRTCAFSGNPLWGIPKAAGHQNRRIAKCVIIFL